MKKNDYDVSIFVINEENDWICTNEYNRDIDGYVKFVCLTNDELNSDFGYNNSICIYRDFKNETDKIITSLSQQYHGCYSYDPRLFAEYRQNTCKWQRICVEIPHNEKYQCIFSPHTMDWKNRENILKHYLDGYLSTQNIMANVPPLLKGEYDKEEYIPAIMVAYNTKVWHNGQTYRGYLPSIGQLAYINYHCGHIARLFDNTTTGCNNVFDTLLRFNPYWSSTECDHRKVWYNHELGQIDKDSFAYVLPLFTL